MQLAVFILVYPFLWLVSRLPFKVLYFLSDLLFPLIYHVIGYRKKVVRKNLELVFPNKTVVERLSIEKKFFKHMCDMFLEMVKTMGISKKEMHKRFTYTNLETLHRIEERGQRVILMASHYGSWEWILSLNEQIKLKGYAIYLKINNKYFDRLVRSIRSKFGTTLITTSETRKTIKKLVNNNELFTLGIASDQSPMVNRARHWQKFMGITVPVHVGGEELSKEHGLIPVFLKVKKLQRGYYQGTFKVLSETPEKVANYGITEKFLSETEKSIKEAPEFYFWTHRRWKHRNKVPKEFEHAKNQTPDRTAMTSK